MSLPKSDTDIPPKVDSTLSKGLSILEALAREPDGKGVSELSRNLGLTKSNTFRLLQTLSTLGYVQCAGNKRYHATLKAWQVGRNVVENLNLRELAGEEMHFLSRQSQETVYLAVPEGYNIIYIDKIDSQQPIRSWNPVGGSAPIYCVGTGKAILATNYAALRDGIADQLQKYTSATITSLDVLDADIQKTIARGYSIDNGEFRERIVSVGAPIILPSGEAVAALGISVPEVNLQPGDIDSLGALVKEAAQSVSMKLSTF